MLCDRAYRSYGLVRGVGEPWAVLPRRVLDLPSPQFAVDGRDMRLRVRAFAHSKTEKEKPYFTYLKDLLLKNHATKATVRLFVR